MLTFVEQTDPILNRPARRLTAAELATDETQQQIDAMIAFAEGLMPGDDDMGKRQVGLAAPLVGIDKAIILFDIVDNGQWSGMLDVLVNPEIVAMDGEELLWWHGCNSTSPICGQLALPSELLVTGMDRDGNKVDRSYRGRLQTHVLWHEIGHIEGRRFPDEVLRQGRQLLVIPDEEMEHFRPDKPWHRTASPAAWNAMKAGEPWKHLL